MKPKEKIKLLREQEGLTQTEMAEKIEVSKQAIQKYESGESGIGLDKVEKYANFFGVSPAYIMGWTDDKYLGMVSEKQASYDYGDPYKPVKDFVDQMFLRLDISSLDDINLEMYRQLMDLNEECLLEYIRHRLQKQAKEKD